jgi:hypothetical protein
MDEAFISAALDEAGADRWDGDAAALAAIATQEGLDQARLCWWIRDHARARGWAAADLRRWAAKYRELLSLIDAGNAHST